VDIPNSCATVYLPTAIFEFDVRPGAGTPYRIPEGTNAPAPPSPDPSLGGCAWHRHNG